MKKIKNEEIKHLIRRGETILQVILLTVMYYVVWRSYGLDVFPAYYGRGKYVLMGVYAIMTTVLFHYSDGFSYGNLKLADISVSQCIAIFLVNFVTYWQLSLIANVMINPVPMLLLTLLDFILCIVCCSIYIAFYHSYHMPRDLVMIYGNRNSLDLEEKMSTRKDK